MKEHNGSDVLSINKNMEWKLLSAEMRYERRYGKLTLQDQIRIEQIQEKIL